MPQLSRLCTISGDEKQLRILDSVPVQITPTSLAGAIFNFSQSNNGILVVTAGTAYNLTPNISFTANVVMWGGGGGLGPASSRGGGGGFSAGIIKFEAGVSYNIAAGSVGGSSAGGGGSGIEFLANANPILIAGGGGGGGVGAGGGIFAANGAAPSNSAGATSYGTTSPGTYRTGGPGAAGAFGMGYGGSGAGGGGGGMYGGQSIASPGGGGGGSGWISPSLDATSNTITGSGSSAANPSHPLRGDFGDGANNGLIIITILNT